MYIQYALVPDLWSQGTFHYLNAPSHNTLLNRLECIEQHVYSSRQDLFPDISDILLHSSQWDIKKGIETLAEQSQYIRQQWIFMNLSVMTCFVIGTNISNDSTGFSDCLHIHVGEKHFLVLFFPGNVFQSCRWPSCHIDAISCPLDFMLQLGNETNQ